MKPTSFHFILLSQTLIQSMNKSLAFSIVVCLILAGCITAKYPSNKVHEIAFENKDADSECTFLFPNPKTDSNLIELRQRYLLDEMTKSAASDIDKALILLDWSHHRWEHSGSNRPSNSDPIYLVEQGEKGEKFRCVEYGIVLSASLNSVGIPTRTISIKTKDVETVKIGAGHVASEAYLPDLGKWVFMDAQLNYIPFLGETPLNAVEYQKAFISEKDKIELRNLKGALKKKKAKKRMNWTAKYLYYFDVPFNSTNEVTACQEKTKLMLVPLNASRPEIFQRKYKLDYCLYTNNLNEFYQNPIIEN